MTPEIVELDRFDCSEQAGDFLVEMAEDVADCVCANERTPCRHPEYFPNTWNAMMGARIIKGATEKLSNVDLLGLIPELTILHLYLNQLVNNCREDNGFFPKNLRRAQEVEHFGLNQPRGRVVMYEELLETKNRVGKRLQSVLR